MHVKYSIHENIKRRCFVEDPDYICVNDFNDEELLRFQYQFQKLEKSGQGIIPIVITSDGGEVHSLLGMIAMIKSSKVPVATVVLSKAFSCGAVLASAGTRGNRYISQCGSILVHQISLGEEGKMSDVQNSLDYAEKLNKTLLSMLDENCGKEPGFFLKHLKGLSNTDFYLKPKEAKKIGLVDHIGVPSLEIKVEQKVSLKII